MKYKIKLPDKNTFEFWLLTISALVTLAWIAGIPQQLYKKNAIVHKTYDKLVQLEKQEQDND